MPSITRVFTLEVTPEKFIDNCSETELQEVFLLANAALNRIERTQAPKAPCSFEENIPKAIPAQMSSKRRTVLLRTKWVPERIAEIREMVRNGQSDAYIANYFNASVVAIQKIRSNNRILRRSRSTAENVKKTPTPVKPKPKLKPGRPKIKKPVKSENIHGFNSYEEEVTRREQAKDTLRKVKQRNAATKKRLLRIDARTTVLVPADTNDAEYIKNYKNKMKL